MEFRQDRIKIVYIIRGTKKIGGAQGIQSSQVIEVLRKIGDVTVISTFEDENVEFINKWHYNSLGKIGKLLREVNTILPLSIWSIRVLIKLRHYRKHIVLTQSTPFEMHFPGLLAKFFYDNYWIASFSDPHPINLVEGTYGNSNRIPVLNSIQQILTQLVCKRADKVLTNSVLAYELMHPKDLLKNKNVIVRHISNTVGVVLKPQSDVRRVIHIGNLTKERAYKNIGQAIKNTLLSKPDVYFEFVGGVTGQWVDDLKRNFGGRIILHGFIPQDEIVKILDRNCTLLLVEAEMPRSPFLPSKFADYLGYQLPLLCVTPKISVVRDYLTVSYLDAFLVDYSCNGILEAVEKLEKYGYDTDKLHNLSLEFGLDAVKKTYLNALEG